MLRAPTNTNGASPWWVADDPIDLSTGEWKLTRVTDDELNVFICGLSNADRFMNRFTVDVDSRSAKPRFQR
jgi:hypothetical protein